MKPTDALNSNFIGITTLQVLGSFSAHHQEFLAVHRHWLPGASCSWQHMVTKSAKCTNADVRLRTPDDGQKGCPKHVES